MPERSSPNLVLRRRLGAELRRLRELAGLTGDDVIGQLSWPSSSKLSRIELGRTGLKPADLQSILRIYGVTGTQRDELTALAREARSTGTVPTVAARFPEEHVAFLQAEADAESIWIWELQIIPGLLQVDSYARALLEPWNARLLRPRAELDRRLEARRRRQEVLTRDPPIQVTAVIDESVLRRRVGGPAVMSRQLRYLIEISESPHTEIRILRLDASHIIAAGAFNCLRLRQEHESLPVYDLVAVEHLTGMTNIDDEDEISQYQAAFRELLEIAVSPADSRSLIAAVADELWS